MSDVALAYPPELFAHYRIQSADKLCEKLDRSSREFSWNERIPELDVWEPNKINALAKNKRKPIIINIALVVFIF